jgi:hypothetical protein
MRPVFPQQQTSLRSSLRPPSAINRHSPRSEEPYQLTRVPALPSTPEMSSPRWSALANTAVVGTAP